MWHDAHPRPAGCSKDAPPRRRHAPHPNAEVLSALYRNCLFRSGVRMDAHEQVSAELAEHALSWKRGVPDAALFRGS